MKRWLWHLILIFLLCGLLFTPITAFAVEGAYHKSALQITTVDNSPLSIDRLLYVALHDIGQNVAITTSPSVQDGYEMADNGDRDGVISLAPNLDETYPRLVKVPVALESTNIRVFVRESSKLEINSWGDLAGIRVAILPQRVELYNQIPKSATISTADTSQKLLEGLSRGIYDAVVLAQREHESLIMPHDVISICDLEELHEYLYLHERNAYLLPQLTEAFSRLFADGRAEEILDYSLPAEMYDKQTVLHIVSSNIEVAREDQFNRLISESIRGDLNIEWYSLSLNSKRFSGDATRLAYFANLLRRDCVSRNIAAIVVSGEEAAEFLREYYLLYFRNTPVLFYSLGDSYSKIIRGYESYFTGVVERLSAYETVEAALSFFPASERLFVINDYTQEGRDYRADIERQLSPFSERIEIEYNEAEPREVLLEKLRALPENSLVLVGAYFLDSNDQYYSLNEMRRAMESACNVPIFSLYSTGLDYGAIGGRCLDYEKFSELISDMLQKVLAGASVADLPVIAETQDYNRWVFDHLKLAEWGIDEDALPKGAQIINAVPSIWESDPRFAISLIALCVMGLAVILGFAMFYSQFREQKELLAKDAKIREVKNRLESLINSAPVAYLLTVDGAAVETNEYITKHIGVKPGDLSVWYYLDPLQRDELVDAASYQRVAENNVVRFKRKNGEIGRFLTNVSMVEYENQQAHMMWAMDIEEYEQQKDRLLETQRDLQAILDNMPAPVNIVAVDSEKVLYGNDSYLRLLEFDSLAELEGLLLRETLNPLQANGMTAAEFAFHALHAPDMNVYELQKISTSGRVIDTRVITRPIEFRGHKSVLGIITDLTAEKEYQHMLESTAEKEKEANQLKSRFLVNMSHEIRTPMNAIIGLTEIELRKNIAPETAEIYRKINSSAKNLLSIINDILDLSKIEADKIELFDEEFELEEVLNSALLVASPRLDDKNVEFMLNAALDLPQFLIGDRTRLWQILKNFLDNAAKYTEKGKIVLSVFVDTLQSDEETVNVAFVVEDTGIGIGDAQKQKLFMPYEQIYSEAQKRYTGTGLGMVISKQLCELMGGTLKLESRLGQGTTVMFNIPFKRTCVDSTAGQALKTPALQEVRVLAADDDELSREIMLRLLKASGAECVAASSGEEALRVLREYRDDGKSFDLILLDYLMGGLDGLETARKIQTALSKSPKLLMVTAYQKLLLKKDWEKCGVNDIIEKPFIPSQFIQKICAVLGHDSIQRISEDNFTRFKDVTVLLCEDYRLNQEVAVGMFDQFGVKAVIADDGRKGLDILESGQEFDLIFMDLQMPVLDGYETTRQIRANSRFDHIPIISLTADAMKEIVERCLEIGMNDHVAKPIEFSSLQRVFLKWLPEHKRQSEQERPAKTAVSDAVARFGGNQELYEKSLREFARDLPEQWPEFAAALQDSEETARLVHRLKGAAGNLSLSGIFESAKLFERSMRNDAPDQDLYEQLVSACNSYKQELSGGAETAQSLLTTGSAEELARLLAKLEQALADHDPIVSAEIVAELQKKTWPLVAENKLSELCSLALDYEFAAAGAVLEDIGGENNG